MDEVIHILYVEDNAGDVALLEMSIDRYCPTLNYMLDVAETIEEAKQTFNADRHILIFIDWNLPDGSGLEVAHFIREADSTLPIFLLSGVLTEKHLLAAEKYKPTACLEKNYDKKFIQDVLKHTGIGAT
jgi:DNA-binding response OmpR family regulator